MRRLLIALVGAAVLVPASAQAAPVTVANNNDTGPGSLRAAVAAANPGDTITIPASVGDITLTSGQIPVTKNLTIVGAGTTEISGNDSSRIFCVSAPACPAAPVGTQPSLSLTDLRITHAAFSATGNHIGGGAIAVSSGALNLTRVAMTNNTFKTDGDQFTGGGAIYTDSAPVAITDSTIGPGNNVQAPRSGNVFGGGAIYSESGTVTITGSHVDGNTFNVGGTGPAIGGGGGIFTDSGDVTLSRSTADGNSITGDVFGSNAIGGSGIGSDRGEIRVGDSHVDENTVTLQDGIAGQIDGGGGLYTGGGALTLSTSTANGNKLQLALSDGAAFNGGAGLFSNGGDVKLTDTAIGHNSLTFSGGKNTHDNGGAAVHVAGGSLDIEGTTLGPENTASLTVGAGDSLNGGGGIFKGAGTATIANSTLASERLVVNGSGNGGGGGAIFNADGDQTLTNDTLNGNTSIGAPGGTITSEGGATTASNTIVAGSNMPDCAKGGTATFTSAGHNIDSAFSCGFELRGIDPKLGPLASNGGPTMTFALLAGSPAIDAGSGCPSVDQRGVARPQGSACDIGAFEFVPPTPAPHVPPLADPPKPPAFTGVRLNTRTLTVKRNAVRARIFCPIGHCTGRLALRASRHRLGGARFSISANRTVDVRIKLTHSALRLLKHHRRLRAIATVTATSNGVTTKGQQKVTLKRRA